MSLGPDDPSVKDLIREFYTSSAVSKHFRSRHLKNVDDDDKVGCQVCRMLLDNKTHFRNHAHKVTKLSRKNQRQRVLGEDHPDTMTSKDHVTNVLRQRAKYDEAEPLYRETLAQREKVLGEDHPDTL
jgi:hypothetical protein